MPLGMGWGQWQWPLATNQQKVLNHLAALLSKSFGYQRLRTSLLRFYGWGSSQFTWQLSLAQPQPWFLSSLID